MAVLVDDEGDLTLAGVVGIDLSIAAARLPNRSASVWKHRPIDLDPETQPTNRSSANAADALYRPRWSRPVGPISASITTAGRGPEQEGRAQMIRRGWMSWISLPVGGSRPATDDRQTATGLSDRGRRRLARGRLRSRPGCGARCRGRLVRWLVCLHRGGSVLNPTPRRCRPIRRCRRR